MQNLLRFPILRPLLKQDLCSVSTVAFYGHRIENTLAAIMAAGGRYVDLEYWNQFGLRFDFINATANQRQHFIKRMETYGLKTLGINAHYAPKRVEKYDSTYFFDRIFCWAKQLSARHTTIQACEGVSSAKSSQTSPEFINHLSIQAREYGLKLLVEVPHPGYCPQKPRTLNAFIEALSPEVGLTIDIGHLSINANSYSTILYKHQNRIGHFHLKIPPTGENLPNRLIEELIISKDVTTCIEIEYPVMEPPSIKDIFEDVRSNLGKDTSLDSKGMNIPNRMDYSNFSERYDAARSQYLTDFEPLANLCEEFTPRFVLDIGCGGGYAAAFLPKDTEIIGIEPCESLLDRAVDRIGDRFIALPIDIRHYTPIRASFDLAICAYTLCHIPCSKQIEIIKRILSSVRRGGYYYFLTPSESIYPFKRDWFESEAWWWVLPLYQYCQLLNDAGFNIIDKLSVNSGITNKFVEGTAIIAKRNK